jgi:hypothetical protein
MPFVQPWLEVDFGSAYAGLGTVGYRLYQADGSDSVARTTTGVVDVSGNGAYGVASVSVPDNAAGVEWDTGGGSPVYAVEDLEPYRDRDELVTDVNAVLADTDAIDARLPSDPADESLQQASHAQTQADIAALNDLAQSDILDDATPFSGADIAAILADTAAIDARLPTDPADQSQVEAAITASESNIRGADNDDLKDISDQIDALPTTAAIATDVWSEPVPGTFGVGEAGKVLGDNLNATVSSRATQAQILNDATPFAGADVGAILTDTAAIDGRLPSDPADESLQQASHAQTQTDIAALNDLDQADVQAAMTAQGYTTTRAVKLDNLDAPVSSVTADLDITNALLHDNGVIDQQTYDADRPTTRTTTY